MATTTKKREGEDWGSSSASDLQCRAEGRLSATALSNMYKALGSFHITKRKCKTKPSSCIHSTALFTERRNSLGVLRA